MLRHQVIALSRSLLQCERKALRPLKYGLDMHR